MENINIQSIVNDLQERIDFLSKQRNFLQEVCKKSDEKKQIWWEYMDKVYEISKEIQAKENYKNNFIRNAEIQVEQEAKDKAMLNGQMGAAIKNLRNTIPKAKEHSDLKRGILDRFKKGKYKSIADKKNDFMVAKQIVVVANEIRPVK